MSTLTCETPSVSSICLPHRWHISWVVVDFLSISLLINSLLFFGNHYDANAEVRTLSALVHPKWKLAVICSAEVSHTLLIDSFRFHSNCVKAITLQLGLMCAPTSEVFIAPILQGYIWKQQLSGPHSRRVGCAHNQASDHRLQCLLDWHDNK